MIYPYPPSLPPQKKRSMKSGQIRFFIYVPLGLHYIYAFSVYLFSSHSLFSLLLFSKHFIHLAFTILYLLFHFTSRLNAFVQGKGRPYCQGAIETLWGTIWFGVPDLISRVWVRYPSSILHHTTLSIIIIP